MRNSTTGLIKETTDVVTKAENLSAYIRDRDDYIYTKERSNASKLLNTLHNKYMQDKDKFINIAMSSEKEDIDPNIQQVSKRNFTYEEFSDAITRLYTQVKSDDVVNLFDIIKEDHITQGGAVDMWCFCCLVKRFNSRNINENGTTYTYLSNKFWKNKNENNRVDLLNGFTRSPVSKGSHENHGKNTLGALAREKNIKDSKIWGDKSNCQTHSSDAAAYIKYWHDTSLPLKLADAKKHVGSTTLTQRDNCSAATAMHVLSEIRDLPTPKTCRGTLQAELIKTNNIKVPSIDIPPPPPVDESVLCYLEPTATTTDGAPKSYRHIKSDSIFYDDKECVTHPKGLKSFDITMNELNKASASDCLDWNRKNNKKIQSPPKRTHHISAVQEMLVGDNKEPMDVVLFGKPLSSNLRKKTNKRYVHSQNPKSTVGSLLGDSGAPRPMSPIRKSHESLLEKSFESMKSALMLEPVTN